MVKKNKKTSMHVPILKTEKKSDTFIPNFPDIIYFNKFNLSKYKETRMPSINSPLPRTIVIHERFPPICYIVKKNDKVP